MVKTWLNGKIVKLKSKIIAIIEAFNYRLRSDCFKAMLKQDLEWHDKAENSVGTLTTKLATETASVQKVTGFKIGIVLQVNSNYLISKKLLFSNYLLQNVSNLGIGIIVAFVTSWTITLLIIAFVPIMALSSALQTQLVSGYILKEKEILEEAGKVFIYAVIYHFYN